MHSPHSSDFTTGSIPRHLIAFSTPMLLGNLLQALYNTVDSIWVGRFLGARALASVSVSFPILFALISLVLGFAMATTTLVSQYYGAKMEDRLKKTITNSLVLMGLSGAVLGILGYLLRGSLLRLIGTPDDIFVLASGYLGVFAVGFFPMFIYNVAGAILRGLGDSRTPLRFLAYATVINIVLDPVLIFGLGPIPALGVAGAALATVIAQSISAVLIVVYLMKTVRLIPGIRDILSLDPALTWLIVKIGLPAGAQQTLVSLGMMALVSIVNRFGSIQAAGYGIGGRIDQFAFMPAMSMGLAVTALVGQNLGAGRGDRVSQIVRWSLLLSGSITGIVALIAVALPKLPLSAFTRDPELLAAGTAYLRWVGLAYVPMACTFVLVGVLRGAGDTMASFFITLLMLWVVRVPLAVYFTTRGGLGVDGVWVSIALSSLVGVTLNALYYGSGRWRKKRLVEKSSDIQEETTKPLPELVVGGDANV